MKTFTHYYVSVYYVFAGADKMKTELYSNGPISCSIASTIKFEAYIGGIYAEKKSFPVVNHEISIVGWGFDTASGLEYWVGRNSWGAYWGERGYFRIQMHKDNLGIETNCVAGIPSLTKVNANKEITK